MVCVSRRVYGHTGMSRHYAFAILFFGVFDHSIIFVKTGIAFLEKIQRMKRRSC